MRQSNERDLVAAVWGAAEVVRLKQVTALGKKVWRLGACFWPT